MPTYTYQCEGGHVFERYLRLSQLDDRQWCESCNRAMTRIITVPALAFAQPEIRYDSPIDGRPITSWAQRREDLDRNHCQPYDPEMKTDANNRVKESTQNLEKAMGETVEAQIEKMPSKKREKLYNEITRAGAEVEYHRATKE